MSQPASRRSRGGSVGLLLVFLIPLALLAIGWGARGRLPTMRLRPEKAAQDTHWAKRANLEMPRDDFGTAVVDGRIYVLGGMTGERGNNLDTTEIYDPATNRWSPGPPLTVGRSSHRAVAVGSTIYVTGGSAVERRPTDLVEALDTTTGRWRRLAPLPTPRFGHALAELDGRIYAIGGYVGGRETDAVDVYDPATDRWTRGAPLGAARYNLAAVAVGGKIYALGGWRKDASSKTVEVYDPAAGRWSPAPDMGAAMSNFGAAVLDGRIYALRHRDLQVFDPALNRWGAGPAMPTTRHGQGVAAVGENLYAIGGCYEDPQYDLPTVEVLLPGPPPAAAAPARTDPYSPGGALAVILGLTASLALVPLVARLDRRSRA